MKTPDLGFFGGGGAILTKFISCPRLKYLLECDEVGFEEDLFKMRQPAGVGSLAAGWAARYKTEGYVALEQGAVRVNCNWINSCPSRRWGFRSGRCKPHTRETNYNTH